MRDILIEPNGKIILGGVFTTVNGVNKNRLCRLNVNGTIDSTFDILTGFDNYINSLTIDNNNKLMVAGAFNSYQSISSNKLIRLLGQSVLRTDNFEKDKIIIFPNPVKDILYIENITDSNYEIYDITGKTVLNGVNNQINLGSLEKGVYFLKVTFEDKVITQNFIKE